MENIRFYNTLTGELVESNDNTSFHSHKGLKDTLRTWIMYTDITIDDIKIDRVTSQGKKYAIDYINKIIKYRG